MYSISIFYFTFYLLGGCVRTQRTPCLRACEEGSVNKNVFGAWPDLLQAGPLFRQNVGAPNI